MNIGIVGTRTRNNTKDFQILKQKFLEVYMPGDTIISGLCPKGADRFAVLLQRELSCKYQWFPADWNTFGWKAGLIRNTSIALKSDILIAMVSKNRNGGTEDTIRKFVCFHGYEYLMVVN